MDVNLDKLKVLLDKKVEYYNRPQFIENDPISIPHRFTDRKDIEIIGFWIAMLSWGQRKTIINKGNELCSIMDYSPYEFIINAGNADLKRLEKFKHRTFNGGDALCFLSFFRWFYNHNDSLEEVFTGCNGNEDGKGLAQMRKIFEQNPDFLPRTKKHVASPESNSSCKRINMFLRWMVRKDDKGVDFGLWNKINQTDLMIPLDVHVLRVAYSFNLLTRDKSDWKSVVELTKVLRQLDPLDPVKYDFALFGMGVQEKNDRL